MDLYLPTWISTPLFGLVGVRETLAGYFVPGRVDMGLRLLGMVLVVSCRVVGGLLGGEKY